MTIQEIIKARDLSGAHLAGFSLGGLNLAGKNFRGADLSDAHLGGADLSGADLRHANLSGANLGAADLTGADLRYADLRETNTANAIFDGADLRECVGLQLNAASHAHHYLKTTPRFEETIEYAEAKRQGYQPLSHWGEAYADADAGDTLYKNTGSWRILKERLGDTIFGDRSTIEQVRLVKRYKHYSQWAYMMTQQGFERIAKTLGINVKAKSA